MVTLITDKLRNQRLDDVQFEPIPQVTRRSWELTSPGWSALSTAALTDKKDTVLSSDALRDHGDSRYNLRGGVYATRARHPSLESSRHLVCDSLSSTPPAPPLKRHCRSLSIPGDLVNSPPPPPPAPHSTKTWQPQAGSVWKPVALRASHLKRRNSPLHKHRHSSGPPGGLSSPVGPPPGSADSAVGPDTLWSVASSDSLSTPPESPVPRPASASSGFYDSSQGSLNAPWLDRGGACNTIKVRSFSMEEPISDVAVVTSSLTAAAMAAGSMPVIPGSVSTPSSPRRCRVPRCRSQPCDLQDRKCGLKRRRDDDRPTLDFFKMKETAYDRSGRVSGRTKNVQFAEQELRSGRILPSIFSEPPECFLGLNTIASSPLDNSHTLLPALASTVGHRNSESAAHPKGDVLKQGSGRQADWVATGDVFPGLDPKGRMITRSILVPNPSNKHHMENEETEYEKEEEDGASSSNRQEEEEEEEGSVQVFHLDMNNDLDIEQIEKD